MCIYACVTERVGFEGCTVGEPWRSESSSFLHGVLGNGLYIF